MAKSVLQDIKECIVTGDTYNLHNHHVLYGTGRRKLSEKYGYVVWLRGDWHNLDIHGVHFNKELDTRLKILAQEHFEANHGSRDDFIKVFGRSYL